MLNALDYKIRHASGYPEDCQSLPLPGYVGKNYLTKRILFIGQSPGQPGQRHDDGYWAGVHHYDKNLTVEELRKHYYQGLVRCNIGVFIKFLMGEYGVTFDDIAFTNVVKCAIKNNNYPSEKTIAFWAPYLSEQLGLLRPKLIVCLGRLAKFFLGNSINFFETATQQLIFGQHGFSAIAVLVLPHPAYISRSSADMMVKAKESFRKALMEAKIV